MNGSDESAINIDERSKLDVNQHDKTFSEKKNPISEK